MLKTQNICILFLALSLWQCKNPPIKDIQTSSTLSMETEAVVGQTIETRFIPPQGYYRTPAPPTSFASYLRALKLKPQGTLVLYYNGSTKKNNNIYEAVIDLPIGNKDLHQCADAVMRLRAEYLWHKRDYDGIHFYFTNGHKVEYSKWMQGYRMKIDGNKTWWTQETSPSNSYNSFWSYMELIFMYAGTASLEKEMLEKNIEKAEIGDVLIQGGHPGHAVIIADKAVNKKSGEPIYILAQSYMPAQEIQILINPNNSSLSPWYEFNKEDIMTPEWSFKHTDLKQFNH